MSIERRAEAVKEEARLDSAAEKPILLRRDERERGVVAYLTINNARHLNAMNSPLMDAFLATMAELAADEHLRAVVLTGAGPKSFIVGADINEMAGIKDAAQATAFITRLHQCCEAIRNLPVPVIARIHGYCFGGGLEMAAACDVRIASEAALFGMQEVKLGIPVGYRGRAAADAGRLGTSTRDHAARRNLHGRAGAGVAAGRARRSRRGTR